MFVELLRLSVNNLSRARGRLLITTGGVIIGTTAVVLLIAMTLGLQQSAESGIGEDESLTRITVRPANQTLNPNEEVEPLTMATLQDFEALDGVEAAVALLPLARNSTLSAGRYEQNVQVFGIDPADIPYLDMTVESGNLSTLQPNQVIVGQRVPQRFVDPRAESWLPVTIDVYQERLRLELTRLDGSMTQRETVEVAGVISSEAQSPYNDRVFMEMGAVLALNEWIQDEELALDEIKFDSVLVRSTGRETTGSVDRQIREMGYATESAGNFLEELNNFFNIMRLVLGGVGGVALLIAAFGVANTMMMATLERTSEIGLMKAIGARDRDVLLIFLIEAALVGLAGGIVGCGAALFLQQQINDFVQQAPAGNNQLNLPFDPTSISGDLMIIPVELLLFATGLATVVGVLAGLIPALRAARMSPVDALKQE